MNAPLAFPWLASRLSSAHPSLPPSLPTLFPRSHGLILFLCSTVDGTLPLMYSGYVHDTQRNGTLLSQFHPVALGLLGDADFQIDGEALVCEFGGVEDPESGIQAIQVCVGAARGCYAMPGRSRAVGCKGFGHPDAQPRSVLGPCFAR